MSRTDHHRHTTTLATFTGHLLRPPSRLMYSHNLSVNGFSAVLSASQAAYLLNLPSVLSIHPDRPHRLQTTRTPTFLGLDEDWGLRRPVSERPALQPPRPAGHPAAMTQTSFLRQWTLQPRTVPIFCDQQWLDRR